MSSRVKGRSGARGAYSSPWSEWVWSDEHQENYRYRLKAPDDSEYEWEWENDQRSETPRTSDDPALAPAPELYSQSQNYTTSTTGVSRPDGGSRTAEPADIDSVTASFAQASINPGSGMNPGAMPYSSNPALDASPYTSAPSNGSQAYASPTTGLQNHIKTRDPYTDREEFDPHYKVHQSWAFKWGRIFKVLWAEPKGAEGDGSTGQSGTESLTVRKGAGGKETWAKVRRFVIIKPMEGHCICLPILTYSGQGVNKRGVHADHHAIIYSGKKPVAFRGEKEKGLQMRSIKVTPDNPRHKLDDASRLNYAKTYTVEYNVKVWFIGKVSSDSEWQIRTDYNRVHPPLEIRGVRPPDTPDDTYEYAQGGSTYTPYTSSYGASSTYPAASSSAAYPAAPAYDAVPTVPGTYGPPTAGADGPASPVGYSTSSFPTPSYASGTYGQDEGYMTGAYRSPERPRRRSRRRGDPEPEVEEAREDEFHDAYDIYDA